MNGERETPLRVDELKGLDELRGYAPEWRGLVAEADTADFFQTWEWTESWLEAFCEPQSLLTLFVRQGPRLVAAVPILEALPRCSAQGRGFSLAANGQSPRSALLHAGALEPVVGAVYSHLRRRAGRPIVFSSPSCAGGSSLFQGLQQAAARNGLGSVARPVRRSPRLAITGTWPDYLKARPSHVRTEWRRKRRRLEAAGKTRFELVTHGGVEAALGDVFEIERHCWKEEQGTSLNSEPGVGDFYRGLARRCAERGWLRLHLLRLDERPVAYTFAVAYAGELLALKTSYDSRLRSASPGIVLMLSALEQAFAEGMTAVDFLGDAARWKAEMASAATELHDVCLFSRGVLKCEVCRQLEVRVRPFVKGRLPMLARLRGRQGHPARAGRES